MDPLLRRIAYLCEQFMTRRIILTIVAALSFASVQLTAQEYEVPEIKISQDKVRVKGKSYYAWYIKYTCYYYGYYIYWNH